MQFDKLKFLREWRLDKLQMMKVALSRYKKSRNPEWLSLYRYEASVSKEVKDYIKKYEQ